MPQLQINLTCENLNLSIKKVTRDSNKQIREKQQKNQKQIMRGVGIEEGGKK